MYIYMYIYMFNYIYIHNTNTSIYIKTHTHIYTYTYVYILIHTYTYICYVFTHVYIYTCVYTHIYIYIHTHTCIFIDIHTYPHFKKKKIYTHIFTHVFTHAHTYTYTYVYINIYIYIVIYSHPIFMCQNWSNGTSLGFEANSSTCRLERRVPTAPPGTGSGLKARCPGRPSCCACHQDCTSPTTSSRRLTWLFTISNCARLGLTAQHRDSNSTGS